MILLPVLLMHFLLMPLANVDPLYYMVLVPGVASLSVLVISLAALWLLSHTLEAVHGRRRFVVAARIMIGAGVLCAICYRGLDFSVYILGPVVAHIFAAFCVLLAMTIAHRFSQHDYSRRRFMTWLLLWLVVIFAALMIPFGIIEFVALLMVEDLLLAPGAGIAIGLLVYIILLPFMLLTFLNSFYRARFYSIFRFEGREGEASKEV
jgi:hypothetical protein